ncbi:MAG TPA: tetratricopeptide repeat protein [Bryobacteraceae bacterium]|nr:tetratricopeptide repeat protein [Bryobacteraceae bacterium]
MIENAALHKIIREKTADGGVLYAMTAIAPQIRPGAVPFSTANPDAVEAWGHANFERAVNLDPDFSAAWLSWAQSLAAAGNGRDALDVAQRALARGGLRSKIDRSQIELLAANLRQDSAARLDALAGLTRVFPRDPSALRNLAQAQFAARRFSEAAQTYQALIPLDASGPLDFNLLGYAQACMGNLDGAKSSFEQYGKRSGQAINALDSLGEALFMNGRFQEAEKKFLEAYQKDPRFLDGLDLWKAAHARWLAGDLAPADQLAAQYTNAQARKPGPLAIWLQATWLYETGRKGQAAALLAKEASNQFFAQQIAVWRNPSAAAPRDLESLRQLYERADPVNDGLQRTLYASALLESGRKDEARNLVQLWPLPPRGNSPLDSLIFPEFLELRDRLR